jgi:hypothetical protein
MMFQSCSSLHTIKIAYTGNANTGFNSFNLWVQGVANSGTFYYKGSDTLSNFGFPSGWEVNPNW